MDKNRIEEGDIVTVHLNDGDMIRYAKVLWSPCATGDSWRFQCDGGKIVYVQTFQLIELVNKGEG